MTVLPNFATSTELMAHARQVKGSAWFDDVASAGTFDYPYLLNTVTRTADPYKYFFVKCALDDESNNRFYTCSYDAYLGAVRVMSDGYLFPEQAQNAALSYANMYSIEWRKDQAKANAPKRIIVPAWRPF